MEMEIICRETIRPSAPTPPHLTIYPLSFIDQLVSRTYVPILYFYYPNQTPQISTLKDSLCQVLSRYYHLAGRFRDQFSIDCNDQGALLLLTRSKGELSHVLRNPTEELLAPLFPDQLHWKQTTSDDCLLAVQINSFACGGVAIAVCMCHQLGDVITLFNFVNDWAAINRKQLPSPPSFLDPTAPVFPQGDMPVFQETVFARDNTVCRRFVFEGSKVESLKAMVSSHNVENPTRVQVVTTLIYKRAVCALGLTFKNTSFRIAVNLRNRVDPPLPEKTTGNMLWYIFVFNPFVEGRETETEVHELVKRMKEGLSDFFGGKEKGSSLISECLKQATAAVPLHAVENQTLFRYTSWCGFPLYEADFGWGKPVWVTTSGCPKTNMVVLMDTRDGRGIEAIVNMEEKDMAMFEIDAVLLQYASLNPTRCTC